MDALGDLVVEVAEVAKEPAVAFRAVDKVGLWTCRGAVATGTLPTFTSVDFSIFVTLVAFFTPVAEAK